MRANRDPLGPQAASNALYGLQGMESRHEETKMVLRELPRLLRETRQPFRPQEIGICLYGFHKMTSDDPETLDVLVELTKKIKDSPHIMDSQCVGNW